MPELPEMETYKILLSQQLCGSTISNIEINREKSVNVMSTDFIREMKEKQLLDIDRRAKYIIFNTESGKSLLLHLMLEGWIYLGNDKDKPDRTKQIILTFGDRSLFFIGLRLGYLHLHDNSALKQKLAGLGPEPIGADFTFPLFQEMLWKKKGKLKMVLLDQQFISGIGSYYSDEICFEAKIRPVVKVDSLSEDDMLRIYNSIRTVLQNAISLGGYMDNPLYAGDKLTGGYNNHRLVYDREGEECKRCGGTITRIELSSRKSFYCPDCQVE